MGISSEPVPHDIKHEAGEWSVKTRSSSIYNFCLENTVDRLYNRQMKRLMTRHFAKWAKKQRLSEESLKKALSEVGADIFEADLGGYIIKKRISFAGKGKRGSGRTIICFRKNDRAVFIHGFAKNECSDITDKELKAFRALAKVLLSLSDDELDIAIKNDNLKELE